ncbi:hypothetical protein HDU83_006788, partial [Entophlyctis luteolus]
DQGCIFVDATRSGKKFPDSLSKTIPIWCAVLNVAVAHLRAASTNQKLPVESNECCWDMSLHTLPTLTSATEHAQIEQRIPEFAAQLLNLHRSGAMDLNLVERKLRKPLRPLWISPDTRYFARVFDLHDLAGEELPFYPIVCVSASAMKGTTDVRGDFVYVQGAADDHELWGMV